MEPVWDFPWDGKVVHGKCCQELFCRDWRFEGTSRCSSQGSRIRWKLPIAYTQTRLQYSRYGAEKGVYQAVFSAVGGLQAVQSHIGTSQLGRLYNRTPFTKSAQDVLVDPLVPHSVGLHQDGVFAVGLCLMEGCAWQYTWEGRRGVNNLPPRTHMLVNDDTPLGQLGVVCRLQPEREMVYQHTSDEHYSALPLSKMKINNKYRSLRSGTERHRSGAGAEARGAN